MKYTIGYEREQFFPMFVYDRELMQQYSTFENFDLFEKYLPCYRYIGYPELIQKSLGLNNPYYDEAILNKGYYSRVREWDGSKFNTIDSIEYAKDISCLKMFENYLHQVKEEGSNVIFVYAPIYIGATEKIVDIEGVYKMYDTIAKKYNIPILDYNYDPMCYDTTYFYNATHLNRMGANLFSVKLAHDIDSLGILK